MGPGFQFVVRQARFTVKLYLTLKGRDGIAPCAVAPEAPLSGDNMNDSMCQQSLMGPHGVFEYMGVCMGRRPKLISSHRDQNL